MTREDDLGRPWHLPAALAAAAALAVAVTGMTLTDLGPWYQSLRQPEWAPAPPFYGIAWTTIYALAALAAVSAWLETRTRAAADLVIGAFALNGFLNVLWSLLFFNARRPDWAFNEGLVLWASVAALILICVRHSKAAALMLLPYLAWVSAAGLLNYEVVRLNGPFG
jgi:benzodiazapine receptor